MKVLIVGSKDVEGYYKLIDKAIDYTKIDRKKIKTVACFDNLVMKWAENNFFKVRKFEANWLDTSVADAIIRVGKDGVEYNAKAGFLRNQSAAKYANILIAIYRNGDKGLEHLIEELKKLNKKVFIYEV